jgi:hypothetical protein
MRYAIFKSQRDIISSFGVASDDLLRWCKRVGADGILEIVL